MQYITNLKRNNALIIESLEKIREIDKIKDDFINIAAHELRTPIQPILGLSDLINSSLHGNHNRLDITELKEDIQIINRNAKKLQKLTNDILDVSRIDSHILSLDISSFDIVDVIRDLVKDLVKQAEKKRYDVSIICKFNDKIIEPDAADITIAPSQIMIRGDKIRLTQVLSNLLNNAIKFTRDGKITITVRSSNDTENVVVSVSDTGQGINTEIIPHLFEKFTSKSDSGTGLGLFISKSIVEAHNGKIWATNNDNGIGSTFSFSVPINYTGRIKE
jgi:signal transduction histidine kinase